MKPAFERFFLFIYLSFQLDYPNPDTELYDLMQRKDMPSIKDPRQNFETDNTIVKNLDLGINDLEAFPELTKNSSKEQLLEAIRDWNEMSMKEKVARIKKIKLVSYYPIPVYTIY